MKLGKQKNALVSHFAGVLSERKKHFTGKAG
jgi:hypothetical protein